MQKEIVSQKHAISLITLFTIGSSLALGVNNDVGKDTWICILSSLVIVTPLLLIYARIAKLYPDKNIFDILIDIFGTFLGKIFIFAITYYAIFLGSLVLRNFTEFIKITDLHDTPQVPVMLAVMIVIVYLVKSGTTTMGKWAFVMLSAVLVLVIITLILALFHMDISNIFPIMDHSVKEMTLVSVNIIAFPFAESVLVLSISNNFDKKSNRTKIFIYGVLIAGVVLLFAFLRNLTVLGDTMLKNSYFPSFNTTRVLGITNNLERVESLITTNFILAGILKIGVCLMAASKGVTKLFNVKEYNKMVIPMGLLMLAMSPIVVKNTMDMFTSMPNYKFYALPIEVVIPLMVWIFAEIKYKKKKKQSKT